MQRIPSFDPSAPTTQKVINVGAADAGSRMLLYNESPYNIDLDFYNGNASILHAWEARYWTLDGDTKQVGWVIDTALNVVTPPISLVMGELYGPHEPLEGSYPMALIRQASVGNQVSTSVASSQTLVNTGNPTGTNVVTVNSTANAGNTFTLTNDGLIQLFVTIAGALVQALKSNETDPILQLGAATHLVEVLGDLTVDGNTILSGTATVNGNATLKGSTSLDNGHFTTDGAGLVNRLEKGILFNHPSYPANELGNIASGDVLSISAAAPRYDTHLKAGSASSGSRIYMEPDLSQVMYAASDGIHVNGANNALFFRNGNAFGAISSFTGSGSGTYNHGNDGTPFFIAPIVSVAGSATQGYDTLTATQCHITLGAALAFKAWTYR